jgi:hypothetical protein
MGGTPKNDRFWAIFPKLHAYFDCSMPPDAPKYIVLNGAPPHLLVFHPPGPAPRPSLRPPLNRCGGEKAERSRLRLRSHRSGAFRG